MTNRFQLNQADHDSIYTDIEKRYLSASEPQQSPRAIITGGQPGSGKSGITSIARSELADAGGYVLIDADKLRSHSPHYTPALQEDDRQAANLIHPDAGQWAQKLTVAAAQQRHNLIIDQTSKDPAAVDDLATRLKSAGYQVELRVMAVNERISEQRIYTRYETQKAVLGFGRFSTKDNHDLAYGGLAKTVASVEANKSVDALVIYDKDHARLYENVTEQGEWQKPPTAATVLQFERERSLTLQERDELAGQYDRLAEMLNSPQRSATDDEKGVVGALQAAAHNDVECVRAQAEQYKEIALAHYGESQTMDVIMRKGALIDAEQRQAFLHTGRASPEQARDAAREDLEAFTFLKGKPEQQSLAVAMAAVENAEYRAYVTDHAPEDFGTATEAAIAADHALNPHDLSLDRDMDY